MRSRYAAFVLQDAAYLLTTWHRSHRPTEITFSQNQAWLSLTVIDTQVNGLESAAVEFVARSRVGQSQLIIHHERSRFVREGGQWFYVDGVMV